MRDEVMVVKCSGQDGQSAWEKTERLRLSESCPAHVVQGVIGKKLVLAKALPDILF